MQPNYVLGQPFGITVVILVVEDVEHWPFQLALVNRDSSGHRCDDGAALLRELANILEKEQRTDLA